MLKFMFINCVSGGKKRSLCLIVSSTLPAIPGAVYIAIFASLQQGEKLVVQKTQ